MEVSVTFRIEGALAIAAAVLCGLTLAWSDWIEIVFGVDPDGGSGALEWALALGFLALGIGFGLLARRVWRRAIA